VQQRAGGHYDVPEQGDGTSEERRDRMCGPEHPLENQHVEREQHQRTEIEEVFGDPPRFDVGEVGERLGVGRVG